MSDEAHRRKRIHPVLKLASCPILTISWGILLISLAWIYDKLGHHLGFDLADVAVALLAILILFLISFGMRAGWEADNYFRATREKCWICRLWPAARLILDWMGYTEPIDSAEPAGDKHHMNASEMQALLGKPPRRGRPPTYPLARWQRVVLAWENRDPLRNPMTLSEFLCEEFGTYVDGSPRMSENSYYEWRKRVLEELRKESAVDKSAL